MIRIGDKDIPLKGERLPKVRLVKSDIEQIPAPGDNIFLSLGVLADDMSFFIVILDVKRARIHIEEVVNRYDKTNMYGVLKRVDDDEQWETLVNSAFQYNLITVERILKIAEYFKDVVNAEALRSLREYAEFIKLYKKLAGK